jgi:hypothetical protein
VRSAPAIGVLAVNRRLPCRRRSSASSAEITSASYRGGRARPCLLAGSAPRVIFLAAARGCPRTYGASAPSLRSPVIFLTVRWGPHPQRYGASAPSLRSPVIFLTVRWGPHPQRYGASAPSLRSGPRGVSFLTSPRPAPRRESERRRRRGTRRSRARRSS